MLILILINVQYLQTVVFTVKKVLNGQNHFFSGYHDLIKKFPPAKFQLGEFPTVIFIPFLKLASTIFHFFTK